MVENAGEEVALMNCAELPAAVKMFDSQIIRTASLV